MKYRLDSTKRKEFGVQKTQFKLFFHFQFASFFELDFSSVN